ncbi:unnamed protein product [Gordionus sp. m RMFG-2023]|uniref:prefoldin subunit 5-like n=1 Tax=Gordionus sp. m RMFG-2023 TaxID=3053472 RepID=UPI0030E20895
MTSNNPQVVNLTQLTIPQLDGLRENIDADIEYLTHSFEQLEIALKKLQNSLNSVEYLGKIKAESQMAMVPLTQSLYVNGEIKLPTKLIIDIGTGYYIEKDVKEAKDYFKRKMDFISRQLDKFKPALNDKISLKKGIEDVIQMKIQAILSLQKQPTSPQNKEIHAK